MRKDVTVILACILMCGGTAMARQNTESYGGAQGRAGGKASEHISEHGMENTNAQWSTGAAKGDERSGLRHQDDRGSGSIETDGRRGHGKDKHESHKYGKDKGDKEHKGKKDHKAKADKMHKGHKNGGKGY